MGVRVHVGSHEELSHALERFKRLLQLQRRWEKWHKPARRGVVEVYFKPSEVRSRRKHVRKLRASWGQWMRQRCRKLGIKVLSPPVWPTGPVAPPRRWEPGS